ncbi:cyclin-T1 isoform X1 [Molossus molossus]|uniref:Cyclin-T1 n=1 Tax=Molossus molossus TaxID=27622 RepID=A0A7J8FW80_MOLMO|nr:cyclin-T1 isoform X1 [Molossus molossus]XP_036107124.1 cyclin-T1 isoform X1 [Molossus molossus]XP_036107125.1 cyclin-T1 isoform X1 [Molossus molossus]KAF6451916.1 cyclin T1 [Molossus molossus]
MEEERRNNNKRWYFTREQLENSPSRRFGVDPDKELSYRQQAANLLQDMGQRLNVSQLTINTAIVYMHRFYMIQSFTQFHRNSVAPAALFLAAKVEEQPKKLEHVIKVAHTCLHPQESLPDTRSEAYLQQVQDLVILESIILQTLGFELTIDHPHTHVVKCTQLVRASKDLAQTSYFMATNSLHLTTFSLQYTPPVVACVCIHLACKWSNWEIPVSTDGKHWWEYVDGTVTLELLDELTHEFLQILEKTPNRLKRIRNWRACQAARKTKTDDRGADANTSEQTILNMISQSSSDTTIAGLMSMSTSSTTSAVPSLTATEESSSNISSMEMLQGERWLSSQTPFKLESAQGHRTSENVALIGVDHSLQQDSTNAFISQKQNSKSVPSAKVSLKEYRAKHAEELAAQKRQLENMEANVKSQYAYAAQNLLSQHDSHSSVILKMPIEGSENPERPFLEKADKTALKMRIPVASGDKAASSKPDEIKMRIKVHAAADKHNSVDDSITKSREHKEKHKTHPSNHHHHHNHHSHKHSHSQLPAGTGNKRPSDPKHSSQTSSLAHKTYSLSSSFSSSSSARKRGLPEETGGAMFDHPAKIAKSTKSSSINLSFPPLPTVAQLPGHSSDTSGLQFSQPSCKTRVPHMKLDKGPAGANGHNTTQTIDYQDTVNMLHSLLSAQGVQPTPPPAFDFVHSYGEYLNPRAGGMSSRSGNTDKPRLPPLPSEPPPPLPPLPK